MYLMKLLSLGKKKVFSLNTVNFQNNAQVQINAWFKLTPSTKEHCLQFITLFLYFKRTPGSI